MLKECLVGLCGTNAHTVTEIDMVSLWTFCLVLATLLLYLVARYQLAGISKTTKADFIKQFNNDFFQEHTRNVVMLLDYEALEYKNKAVQLEGETNKKAFPYFSIVADVLAQMGVSDEIKAELSKKGMYSCFEIDDILLGRFEDVGLFEKQGFLHIKDVCNHFHWYIDLTWQNKEIQKYVQSQRALYGPLIYCNFEYIFNKCNRSHNTSTIVFALWSRAKSTIKELRRRG